MTDDMLCIILLTLMAFVGYVIGFLTGREWGKGNTK